MRIGVDAREIQDGVITGIGRSLANFIHYFGKHEKAHILVMFSEKTIPVPFQGNVRQVVIEASPTLVWDQWHLPMALKANHIDLFYSPYYKVPLSTRVPVVNQILDLMYLVFPAYRRNMGILGRLYYDTFGKAFTRKSMSIITDSKHARGDITRIWRVKPEKIAVIPLGVAGRYVPVNDEALLSQVRRRLGLPGRYILYLGNFKPHKNVVSLVLAFQRTHKSFPEYKLVLAGPLDSNGVEMQALVSKEGLHDRVVFTDTIREEDCPEALLSMADLFVFPTLYEGFGLPPLEAMACGTPVITSNLTAVPEVVGHAGVMVNPLDVEELSRAIAGLLEDPEKRALYSRKGLERSRLFSEEKTAGKIYQHIISLLEGIA
ncbi:MAG: glycosyltransferase family 1 protein [Thermodesulfobacteriota bacterium]|nr:glycosyltransferase family 1 protein [Thermodesulfobacteriota bacterium]